MAGIFKTIIFMGISYFLFNYFFSDNPTEKIDGLVTKATDFVAPVIAIDTPPTAETESNPFALDDHHQYLRNNHQHQDNTNTRT